MCDVGYLCANFGPGLCVLDLGPMYATDRQTDVRRASSLNASYPRGGVVISYNTLDVFVQVTGQNSTKRCM